MQANPHSLPFINPFFVPILGAGLTIGIAVVGFGLNLFGYSHLCQMLQHYSARPSNDSATPLVPRPNGRPNSTSGPNFSPPRDSILASELPRLPGGDAGNNPEDFGADEGQGPKSH